MRYTVTWHHAAEAELASLWMAATDRREVTDAAAEIDRRLKNDPDQQGVPFHHRRLLVEPPLAVTFAIHPDDRIVRVLQVWRPEAPIYVMPHPYLLTGCRTPIGKLLGALKDVPATELGAHVVRGCIERAGLRPEQVDEVIMGNILSAGLGQAPARQAALKAGLPGSVAALTINKMCGSGLKAVMLAAQAIRAGDADLVIAGGMESMTRAPHLLLGSREGHKYGDVALKDHMILDGLWCAFEDCAMGAEAEYTARKYGISRADQDAYAAESQRRAAAASESGAFDAEIVPVPLPGRSRGTAGLSKGGAAGLPSSAKGDAPTSGTGVSPVAGSSSSSGTGVSPVAHLLTRDQGPRPDTSVEKLAALRPAFEAEGTVTAGNASMLSDGAAALLVASPEAAERVALRDPAHDFRARIVAQATAGVEPKEIFIAPVLAVRKVLEKAGLAADAIDLFEINEAFASQMLACIGQLELDPAKVNVHGGAIALGHPIGASGARVLVTLLSALKQRGLRRGLAALCLGGGNAVAMIVERE